MQSPNEKLAQDLIQHGKKVDIDPLRSFEKVRKVPLTNKQILDKKTTENRAQLRATCPLYKSIANYLQRLNYHARRAKMTEEEKEQIRKKKREYYAECNDEIGREVEAEKTKSLAEFPERKRELSTNSTELLLWYSQD